MEYNDNGYPTVPIDVLIWKKDFDWFSFSQFHPCQFVTEIEQRVSNVQFLIPGYWISNKNNQNTGLTIYGSQLAKLKNSIPLMLLPCNLNGRSQLV